MALDRTPAQSVTLDDVLSGHRTVSRTHRRLWVFAVLAIIIYAVLTVEFAPSKMGAVRWAGEMALAMFNGFCLLILAQVIVVQAWVWRSAIRLVGWQSFRMAGRIRRMHSLSRSGGRFLPSLGCLVVLVAVISILVGSLGGIRFVIGIVAFTAAFGLFGFCHYWRPPIILFLTTSIPETLTLVARMRWACGQNHRVVALLDERQAASAEIGQYSNQDNLRMRDDADWEAIVHELMGLVRYVVIDLRYPAGGVIKEVNYLLDFGLLQKTIFLVGPGLARPALDVAAAGREFDKAEVRCAEESNIDRVLTHLLATRSSVAEACPALQDLLALQSKAASTREGQI